MTAEAESGPSSSGRPFRDWYPPKGHSGTSKGGIQLLNSLTDRLENFVPKGGPDSKKIVWYSCGPTVYDSAHMGHSRNYVTIDLMRRILEDYFGYSIMFVMNITDVDDKIVVKARRNHLLKNYREHATDLTKVREDTDSALESSTQKQQAAYDEAAARHEDAAKVLQDFRSESSSLEAVERKQRDAKLQKQRDALGESAAGELHKLQALKSSQQELPSVYAKAVIKAQNGDLAGALSDVLDKAGDQVALQLDRQFGATITDEAIFRKHAQRYENEFWHDMELLGTRKPTVLTRVTEYMPQIVDYIQQIMANGFAYASGQAKPNGNIANGHHKEDHSVYFDTEAFEKSGHVYPKLNPWAAGSSALASESESNFTTSDKKNPRDFALWKASKAGEPSWPSPWGRGRPGWHIECSAMASWVIGDKVDIHTGGQDLRFPHHDNELAQAEAYYHGDCGCSSQWVNYFLHSGHLSIDGLKMSKSLKNFITIREALQDFSASQLRLMFAMQPWHKEMTFGKTMREEMAAKEHVFKHFFHKVDVLLRKQTPVLKYEDLEKALEHKIEHAKADVDDSFRRNLNTASALQALIALISSTHEYISRRESDSAATPPGPSAHPYLLRESAGLVTKILRILGISTAGMDDLGLGGPGLTATTQQLLDVYESFRACIATHPEMAQVCKAAVIDEDSSLRVGSPSSVLERLTEFRTEIRQAAKTMKVRPALEACDRIRDKTLVELGVRMEDLSDGSSVWMAEDPATLKAEAKAREDQARQARLLKQLGAIEKKRQTYQKALTQSRLPTVQQSLGEKYSRFTSDGQDANPTHNAQGEELSTSDLKKGKSAADKARKLRHFYDTQIKEKGASFLEVLDSEIKEAEAALPQNYTLC